MFAQREWRHLDIWAGWHIRQWTLSLGAIFGSERAAEGDIVALSLGIGPFFVGARLTR